MRRYILLEGDAGMVRLEREGGFVRARVDMTNGCPSGAWAYLYQNGRTVRICRLDGGAGERLIGGGELEKSGLSFGGAGALVCSGEPPALLAWGGAEREEILGCGLFSPEPERAREKERPARKVRAGREKEAAAPPEPAPFEERFGGDFSLSWVTAGLSEVDMTLASVRNLFADRDTVRCVMSAGGLYLGFGSGAVMTVAVPWRTGEPLPFTRVLRAVSYIAGKNGDGCVCVGVDTANDVVFPAVFRRSLSEN